MVWPSHTLHRDAQTWSQKLTGCPSSTWDTHTGDRWQAAPPTFTCLPRGLHGQALQTDWSTWRLSVSAGTHVCTHTDTYTKKISLGVDTCSQAGLGVNSLHSEPRFEQTIDSLAYPCPQLTPKDVCDYIYMCVCLSPGFCLCASLPGLTLLETGLGWRPPGAGLLPWLILLLPCPEAMACLSGLFLAPAQQEGRTSFP